MSKIAIITGGSRGLGRADALHAAKKGIDSIITFQTNKEMADSLVSEIQSLGQKAVALRLDTSDISQFDGFVEQIKETLHTTWNRETFDFLVNNAGIGQHIAIKDVTENDFDAIMNVHVKGVFFLTQKLLPVMEDGGRIINISTGLTRFSVPGSAVYASAKGAIEVFTHYLALEFGERNISAVTLAPGAIATDFGGGHTRDDVNVNSMVASMTALGRVGEADDVGGAIAALLSEDTKWINGTRIEVSGGMRL